MSDSICHVALSRRRKFIFVQCLFALSSLAACSFETPGGKEVIVAADRIRLRSSTAEAARTVGELKLGERATIKEQEEEGSTTWVRVVGPNDQKGWTEMSNLLEVEAAEKSKKLSEQMQDIQTQAIGRSKAALKLRLTPDRSSEDNVLVLLPAGTLLEIVGRERKQRPDKEDQKEGEDTNQAAQGSQPVRYDDWYNVRLPSNAVLPAGWIYGGSVDLEIPGEIVYYSSTGRKIVGWMKLGENSGANEMDAPYLVMERHVFGAEGDVDFDRIKMLVWDRTRRDYYTAFREEIKGSLPVELKLEGRRGTFTVHSTSGTSSYDFEIPVDGKAKAKKR